jgi:hypothetical protein
MMRVAMRRSPALTVPDSKRATDTSARDGRSVQLVCLSLALAVVALALRIASIL